MFLPEIDLHLHSTASDGICSPKELVSKARKMGLAAISVADHDTVAGVPEAIAEGEEAGVEVVPAIEIGSYFSERSIHILGYFIDLENASLRDFARSKREARMARAAEIVRRLSSDGLPLDMDAVLRIARGGALGRVHIARVLADKGVVPTVAEGFNRYLKHGTPYYVPMVKPSPTEAIGIIEQAGGTASLAHPVFIREDLLKSLLPALCEAGLGAIEVLCGFDADYGLSVEEHLSRCSELSGLAVKYGLARTGGSDFHGLSVKAQDIGSAHAPLSFLVELKVKHGVIDGLKSHATTGYAKA